MRSGLIIMVPTVVCIFMRNKGTVLVPRFGGNNGVPCFIRHGLLRTVFRELDLNIAFPVLCSAFYARNVRCDLSSRIRSLLLQLFLPASKENRAFLLPSICFLSMQHASTKGIENSV